jgi:hypothetical protein
MIKYDRIATMITATAFCALLTGLAIAAPTARSFASPQQAVDALVSALRSGDIPTLEGILGPDGEAIVHSGDRADDQMRQKRFLAAYDAHSEIVRKDATHMAVEVGDDKWPLPIPIVKVGTGWQFDAKAGAQELLARRIGENELDAIQACLAYVDAQRDYASVDRGDHVLDYARRFVSTNGKTDGLYWPTKPGQPQSPLGPAFAQARQQGYMFDGPRDANTPVPYHGYYFKILEGQGPAAKGGAYGYVVNGKMIGGFALVASPAMYRLSGVTTFIVNQDGTVFQTDLGPDTPAIVQKMTVFDPGKGWTPVSNAS